MIKTIIILIGSFLRVMFDGSRNNDKAVTL